MPEVKSKPEPPARPDETTYRLARPNGQPPEAKRRAAGRSAINHRHSSITKNGIHPVPKKTKLRKTGQIAFAKPFSARRLQKSHPAEERKKDALHAPQNSWRFSDAGKDFSGTSGKWRIK